MLVGSGIGPATRAPVRLAVSTISHRGLIEEPVVVRLQPDPDLLVHHHALAVEPVARAIELAPYSMISVTTPAPTVRPPSRIANRSPFSIAIGVISSTSICTLSPGITISTPSGSCATPVTSVVRK